MQGLEIEGCEELLSSIEEIFAGRKKSITMIKNGFHIHCDGLPYDFHVSCFEEIGWNVFLSSLTNSLDEDFETNALYEKLEESVDEINTIYFNFGDTEQEQISYNFFKLKSLTEDKIQEAKLTAEISDNGRYVLHIEIKDDTQNSLGLEAGYSKIFSRWYSDIKNKDYLLKNRGVRKCVEEINCLISSFNSAHLVSGHELCETVN